MNDRQNNKYRMFRAVQQTCQAHEATWSGVPAAVTLLTDFGDRLDALDEAVNDQAVITTGLTESKKDLRAAMADQAVTVGRMLAAYASVNGLAELHARVDHTPTDYRRAREAEALTMARDVLAAGREHAAETTDYGVSVERLDALDAATAAFAEALGATRSATADRTAATETVADLIDGLDDLLDDQLDPLFYQFNGTGFFAAYTTSRQIVDLGS